MEDSRIIELFLARSDEALRAAEKKYGGLCFKTAVRILSDRGDAEEAVNDTLLKAWNSIPPNRPEKLSAYLVKICRNTALAGLQKLSAQKRGGGMLPQLLGELAECVPESGGVEEEADRAALCGALNRFLSELEPETRRVFLQRYWYMCSISEIAAEENSGESRIKMLLLRTRQKLKRFLEQEGFDL